VVHELIESSKFEPGESDRRKLEDLASLAQRLFLYLLAIVQHRPFVRPDAVPEPLRVASERFRTRLADELETLAARTDGQVDRPGQDLRTALAELEQSAGSSHDARTEVKVTGQAHRRLGLYREVARILAQMTRLQAELVATSPPQP
jgi:hypothetical protein